MGVGLEFGLLITVNNTNLRRRNGDSMQSLKLSTERTLLIISTLALQRNLRSLKWKRINSLRSLRLKEWEKNPNLIWTVRRKHVLVLFVIARKSLQRCLKLTGLRINPLFLVLLEEEPKTSTMLVIVMRM